MMGVKLYEKRIQVQALQFQGYPPTEPLHMNDIIAFVNVPTTMEFNTIGGVQLRVVLGQYDVLIFQVGDYIVKDAKGKITRMTKTAFEDEYTEVNE